MIETRNTTHTQITISKETNVEEITEAVAFYVNQLEGEKQREDPSFHPELVQK